MIQELRSLTSEDKFKHIKLRSLERLSVREDLIKIYKWNGNCNNGDINKALVVSESVGHVAMGLSD